MLLALFTVMLHDQKFALPAGQYEQSIIISMSLGTIACIDITRYLFTFCDSAKNDI